MMSLARIRGLVAAAFTPMKEDGSLNLDRIPDVVDHLILTDYPFRHSLKVMMKFVGVDCGPSRRPIPLTSVQQEEEIKRRLDEIGFFEWGRKQ